MMVMEPKQVLVNSHQVRRPKLVLKRNSFVHLLNRKYPVTCHDGRIVTRPAYSLARGHYEATLTR